MNSSGSPATGRPLTASDRIVYGVMEVDLRTAERMGLVTVNHLGRYEATAQGNDGASPRKAAVVETPLGDGGTAEAAAAEGFRADADTEEALSTLVSSLPQDLNMSMLGSYIRDGDVTADQIARAASQAGVEPDAMAGMIPGAMEGMEAAVEERLASLGVHDGDLFGEWVNGSSANRAAANEAILALALHNSTHGFEQLAVQFSEQLDTIAPDDVAEALTEAGLPFTRQGGKTIITFPDGTQASYGVAVKQRLIKVSRNR